MIDRTRHDGDARRTTHGSVPPAHSRPSWSRCLRMRLQVEREIDDLTRDHGRDQRVLAEAAVRLPSDALAIGLLSRARARRAREEGR